jgi:sRNA-binding regulator protein Hfq
VTAPLPRNQPIVNRRARPKATAIKPPELDPWLSRERMASQRLEVHLLTSEVMAGARLVEVSRYAITVLVDGEERCVWKHAIAWAVRTP